MHASIDGSRDLLHHVPSAVGSYGGRSRSLGSSRRGGRTQNPR